ncbi:MAG TPA: hypothetical protein VNL98_10845 [Gemmatimonadales bacterium]|nr:hypothetical protein [Gemmatimonadales bacterium]
MAAIFLATSYASGQQVNDARFHFANPRPAFPQGEGPSICFDEAHHNSHTLSQLYAPFASILRSDGFRVSRLSRSLSSEALDTCHILVLGSGRARSAQSAEFWSYPHPSAYTREEVDAVVRWVRSGGALLFIWDHPPAAGAAAGLANLLGVQVLDAWADATPRGAYPEVFRRTDGLFADHVILRGRSPMERIDSVATHGAGAFFPSRSIQPVLVYGGEASAWVRLGDLGQGIPDIPEAEWPRFDIQGWLLAGTREWDQGRIVFLGDSTACPAQLYGSESTPIAMSHPSGRQNAQFCLNLVRWLARAL